MSYSDEGNKPTILLVDDTPDNIAVLSGLLRERFKVKAALNGRRALTIAASEPHPAIILLDIMMPEMDGYEVCRRLKQDPVTRSIPVIFVTAKNQECDEQLGFDLGAVDFISKPFRPTIVKTRIETQLALHDQNRMLEQKVRERTAELKATRLEVIQRLGRAAEFKDNETGLHVVRMSHFTRLIAQSVGFDDEYVDLLFHAAPMHDIGKIGIPDHILLKPGKLDSQEWEVMSQHPRFGAEIIGDHDSEVLGLAREIALNHHEKWDGSGYPQGLEGSEIPISARIIAIADVFDALTTERPYKRAWSVDDAIRYIDDNSGIHFDPTLVAAFHRVLDDILAIREQYAEDSAPVSLGAASKQ